MRDLRRSTNLEQHAQAAGVQLQLVQLDVTDADSIQRAVETILTDTGRIDALVNNAGAQVRGFFEDLTQAEIEHIFNTNIFGTMAVTRAVLPHMRRAGQGRVVIVSSVLGRLGMVGLSSYCATKFALGGFAESLALEVAPLHLKVSLIEPGLVKTQIWDHNRATAENAGSPSSPYYALFHNLERFTDQWLARAPVTVEDVADVIYKSLTHRHPRFRYVVGARAGILLKLRRYMPEELFNRLYTYVMRRYILCA